MLMRSATHRRMARLLRWLGAALAVGLLLWHGLPAQAVTLERLISREDPKFDCANAQMSVGRDGNVYLAIGGYLLRLSRDGTQKLGGDIALDGLINATANADGIIASANAHFNSSVNLYDRNINRSGACSGFLVNDTVGWDAPACVVAGASGDFYGIDQHRQRILRINPAGKNVKIYPFPAETKPWDFRVCEATQTFVLRGQDGVLRGVGFDGAIHWTRKHGGLYDVDPAGTVYLLDQTTVTRLEPDPQKPGDVVDSPTRVTLPADQLAGATGIAVFGNELIVKRTQPAELFQVYDLTTGAQKRVVSADHERVTAEYPSVVWTAGQPVSCKITSSDPAAQWRVWATPFGDADWRELTRTGDQLDVPASFAGLYQLRIAPTLNPQADCEFTLHAVIEVRAPASKGTVSVWTPMDRVWWGRGEEMPVGVVVRTAAAKAPVAALLTLTGADAKPLWSSALTLTPNTEANVTLPAAVTAQLAPGRYLLHADVPGYTCAAQPIRLGPGLAAQSPFRITLHGDYSNLNSTADAWSFADVAENMRTHAQTLGINQYVNRIFAGRYSFIFATNADGYGLMVNETQRLNADPAGVSPQKVAFGFPDAHALGALGASGQRMWLLLVGMDTALPIGASFPWAKGMTPAEYATYITDFTKPLLSYPAFRGWDWVANWWVADPKLRYATPDEGTKYAAALKQADATGVWDPVLDAVGDRTVGWQPDAQQGFKEALAKIAPNLATASAGPYRRPEIYPPASFGNVDEVDLHYQAEQITTPNWTAHAPDFYQRPGKPTWMHPELFNDTGTGEMILPMSWLGLMRGADGIGASGDIPSWGAQASEARSGYAGMLSVYRALNTVARQYGPWLTTLENHDRVAIVVSHRQLKLDAWGGFGGRYFTRLFEAYQSCLYAHQPATFLYTEDVKPDTLKRFKALLLVGQGYEMEPALAELLAQAKQQGLAIFADGSCRDSLVKAYTPLGVSFDHVEKLNGFNNDYAYWDFPDVLLANAPLVAAKLAAVVPPVAVVDHPEVLLSERRNGDARFLWVVNDTRSPLDPGSLWRLNNAVATRLPVLAKVTLPLAKGEVAYDVFSGTKVGAECTADLRYTQARLYALLPRAIQKLRLTMPRNVKPGQTLNWTASVPGITASLPLHIVLRDAAGAVLDERFTTTGSGAFNVPLNAAMPVTLSATELISGQRAGAATADPAQRLQCADRNFGPRLRDIAVSPDGATAVLNAFDWGENLYTLDLATGNTRWRGNIGHYFAYAPVATRDGFTVQGYDLGAAEGYHLYRLDGAGRVTRRFALPGIPSRMLGWAFPMMNDHINNFAVAPGGEWIAGAGDLALVVWSADGKLLWSQDWSVNSRMTPRLLALGNDSLLVANGMTMTAYDAQTGKAQWHVTLDSAGDILGVTASADGRTLVARTSMRSGRVFVVRDAKVIGALPTAADDAVLSQDGAQLALTNGAELKWYTAEGNLMWVYHADATLRTPRLSPDGKRLALGSEQGTLYLCELATGAMRARDCGALPVPAWLPNGDLLAATWMGTVCRLAADGTERWQVQLSGARPGVAQAGAAGADVPTTRYTAWSNAEPTPLALTPNLLAANKVRIKALVGTSALELTHPVNLLYDGQPKAPATPWLKWEDCGMIDSGWRGTFTLEFDASPARLRVTALTFVEDAAHPESWLRDARFEYWDAAQEKWVLAQYLTSDTAIHTHKLAQPVEASKFRLACPHGGDNGAGWPTGNLRLAQIVFHGDTLDTQAPSGKP